MRLQKYRKKWAAVWSEGGKTKRVSLRTSDRGVAERRLNDQMKKPVGDTVEAIVTLYLADKVTARSYQSMLTSWRALKPSFGDLRPDQITKTLTRKYRAKRMVKDGTIIKDLGFLRAAMKWSKKDIDIEMPPAPPPRERYITREEHQRLVNACELPHIRLFVILAWATAGRHSAILELEWSQIDFAREQIHLAKGSGRRKGRATVPMTQQAKAALEEEYERRTCDHVISWAGKPVKAIKGAFEAACTRTGLKGVTPHVLRHSAAVRMAEAGVPITVIGQYLGHTDPRVTYRVYARYSPEHLREAAGALE